MTAISSSSARGNVSIFFLHVARYHGVSLLEVCVLFVMTRAPRSVAATSHTGEGLGVGVRPARRWRRVRQSGWVRIHTVNIARTSFLTACEEHVSLPRQQSFACPACTYSQCVFVPVWCEVGTCNASRK